MGKLLDLGNRYLKESDWKVFAVLKFCPVSMGILIGFHVPQKGKKAVAIGCAAVFLSTYVPLMAKLLRTEYFIRADEPALIEKCRCVSEEICREKRY